MTQSEYWKELAQFLKDKCAGPEYDSCHDSPCRYASSDGCTHSDHPIHKFRQDQGEAAA